MSYSVKRIDVDTGDYQCVMHDEEAVALGLHKDDRVKIRTPKKTITTRLHTTDTMVKTGEIGLFENVYQLLHLKPKDKIDVIPTVKPASVEYIKRKMNGEELTTEEINTIIRDIAERNLSEIELSAYVTSLEIRGMNTRETMDTTMAMVKTGDTIDFDRKPVFDFHSVGGAPGNKITLMIVPIVAAAGLMIPKTSSRAISSACGTADIFEVIANVSLSIKDIKYISETIGGVIAWGGGVNIAPADDRIIRVEYPLAIDPYSQVIASVLAKKKAINAEYLLLDIPTGEGTKVPNMDLARRYARDFIEIGDRIGMKVECAITYGGQPIGYAIGPALEAQEALYALEGGEVPSSLMGKATNLAGIILEMGGVAQPGEGKGQAIDLIKSGAALKKLKEIIKAQGGDPKISSKKMEAKIGKFSADFLSPAEGYVDHIYNKRIVQIARTAGAPNDHGAGLRFKYKKGDRVEMGQTVFTVFSENERKLHEAMALANKIRPVDIEGMVIERVPSIRGGYQAL